ncbi:PQQ-binding-like beta-propeller repeat protein [Haloplanus halobius]|uniref:outer membrane protein assembly factor BamB family protein n=1 Tax=Haloplanus halobius TaxID=2934938 RepID=UPI003CE4B3EF
MTYNKPSESVTDAVDLGSIDSAGSRHAGQRSAVALADDVIVAGRADGDCLGVDPSTLAERWRACCARESTSVVSAAPFAGGVLVGERSPCGAVRLHDADTGAVRWRHDTSETVGAPTRDTRFFLPYVADIVVGGDYAYVAARRYERAGDAGGERAFESVVLALAPDGRVAWRYRTDASPIALATDADRVAVAYNRCPGDHDAGLVVLDAATGAERQCWNPPTTDALERSGDRRVGDVSFLSDGLAVTSHADFRGYRLDRGGDVRWRVDLATPTVVGDETRYAYPNHVHATPAGVVFVTGNTYAVEGRETEGTHDRATAAFGYAADGDQRWSASLGGFATGLVATADRVAIPVAQGFRTRDPEVHGVRIADVAAGDIRHVATDGITTAVAAADGRVAAIEEPVRYHDNGERRGAYRLHVTTTN